MKVDDVGVSEKGDENVEALEEGENVGVVQSPIDVANSMINESLSNLCEFGLLTTREKEDEGNEKSVQGDDKDQVSKTVTKEMKLLSKNRLS